LLGIYAELSSAIIRISWGHIRHVDMWYGV